jgi:hypothetical protein
MYDSIFCLFEAMHLLLLLDLLAHEGNTIEDVAGCNIIMCVVTSPAATRAVNQLIDYQLIAILIDYFNYQFNYLKPTSISISISSCQWRPIELSAN